MTENAVISMGQSATEYQSRGFKQFLKDNEQGLRKYISDMVGYTKFYNLHMGTTREDVKLDSFWENEFDDIERELARDDGKKIPKKSGPNKKLVAGGILALLGLSATGAGLYLALSGEEDKNPAIVYTNPNPEYDGPSFYAYQVDDIQMRERKDGVHVAEISFYDEVSETYQSLNVSEDDTTISFAGPNGFCTTPTNRDLPKSDNLDRAVELWEDDWDYNMSEIQKLLEDGENMGLRKNKGTRSDLSGIYFYHNKDVLDSDIKGAQERWEETKEQLIEDSAEHGEIKAEISTRQYVSVPFFATGLLFSMGSIYNFYREHQKHEISEKDIMEGDGRTTPKRKLGIIEFSD